jgi:hypothetical protein
MSVHLSVHPSINPSLRLTACPFVLLSVANHVLGKDIEICVFDKEGERDRLSLKEE